MTLKSLEGEFTICFVQQYVLEATMFLAFTVKAWQKNLATAHCPCRVEYTLAKNDKNGNIETLLVDPTTIFFLLVVYTVKQIGFYIIVLICRVCQSEVEPTIAFGLHMLRFALAFLGCRWSSSCVHHGSRAQNVTTKSTSLKKQPLILWAKGCYVIDVSICKHSAK